MMNILNLFKLIPRRVIIIHLSWFGSLLLFMLVVILPLQGFRTGLDEQLNDIQNQLNEQKSLQPIYQSLKTKSQASAVGILPIPEGGKLSRDLISTAPSTIGRIAKNTSMKTMSISLDVNSLANQSRSLLMHAVIRGDFMNFRKFIIGIGELPYLEKLETIEIRQGPDSTTEFGIKIRLALS